LPICAIIGAARNDSLRLMPINQLARLPINECASQHLSAAEAPAGNEPSKKKRIARGALPTRRDDPLGGGADLVLGSKRHSAFSLRGALDGTLTHRPQATDFTSRAIRCVIAGDGGRGKAALIEAAGWTGG
jgi:hypothetical protein